MYLNLGGEYMNNIKFRAYDKDNGVMYYSDDGSDQYIFQVDWKKGVQLLLCDDGNYCVVENAEIMQSACCEDNNNREAYKGDILGESPYRKNKLIISSYGVIKQERDTYNLYIEWNFKRKYQNEEYWDKSILPLRKVNDFNIIGNIYDNPELLKVENE